MFRNWIVNARFELGVTQRKRYHLRNRVDDAFNEIHSDSLQLRYDTEKVKTATLTKVIVKLKDQFKKIQETERRQHKEKIESIIDRNKSDLAYFDEIKNLMNRRESEISKSSKRVKTDSKKEGWIDLTHNKF